MCLRKSGDACAGAMQEASSAAEEEGPTSQEWAKAFGCAIEALQHYSQAQKGDRTMLDALIPAQEAFSEAVQSGAFHMH